MSQHMFVDESKSGGLLLAAACLTSDTLEAGRESLRSLLLPGQERLHFSSERDTRRRLILRTVSETVAAVVLVQADPRASPRLQRERALTVLAGHASRESVVRLWIEQDDAVVEFDRRVMYEHSRLTGTQSHFSYGWLRPRQEPLLWCADAVAWAWARGGRWRAVVSDTMAVTHLDAP